MSTIVDDLKQEVASLRDELQRMRQMGASSYYYSKAALEAPAAAAGIPPDGMPPKTARTVIENSHAIDFNQKLNTASYVNVEFEEDEEAVALMGLRINLADQTVYPRSYELHDAVVNMIARLWHCPKPEDFAQYHVFPGAGTVGSTEACRLACSPASHSSSAGGGGNAERSASSVHAVRGELPNLVISSCFQAAWEKLFKYMDVEPRLIFPHRDTFTVDPEQVRAAIDERTIGVVCIMGNHYAGHYDPVWDVSRVVDEVNRERNLQVGIHIDAASGGFIAPFQTLPAWDFRLPNVLSISASGHKYGESCCGTGWIVWRERTNLSEHVATSVSYLGGKADSYTLNFSRPASGVYVQYYKFLRYGLAGYQQVCENMMGNAKYIRDGLKALTWKGQPRFTLLDHGDEGCLPVVAARLNPACGFTYDDIDLQHALSQHHWYVGGYKMSLTHPLTEEILPLCRDEDPERTMFRIVVKNNLTRRMADHLLSSIAETFKFLDAVDFSGLHGFDSRWLRHKDQRRLTQHC